jgi:hypothetical protein
MTRDDINNHVDGMLTLLILDRSGEGNPEPMSRRELAKAIGLTSDELGLIEKDIFCKLRHHPLIWEAVTSGYRSHQ